MFEIRYVLVVRPLTPHVRNAVDEEGDIQRHAEAEVEVYPERNPQRLRPIVVGYHYWQSDGQERKERDVQSAEISRKLIYRSDVVDLREGRRVRESKINFKLNWEIYLRTMNKISK